MSHYPALPILKPVQMVPQAPPIAKSPSRKKTLTINLSKITTNLIRKQVIYNSQPQGVPEFKALSNRESQEPKLLSPRPNQVATK